MAVDNGYPRDIASLPTCDFCGQRGPGRHNIPRHYDLKRHQHVDSNPNIATTLWLVGTWCTQIQSGKICSWDCWGFQCNAPSVKKKKKKKKEKKKDQIVLVPTCSPPNPTTHHTIHSLFSLFGRSLSLLFSFSFSFSVNTTHIHTLLSLTLPPEHSSSSPLPFFPAKSLENPQEHHTFT